MRMRMNSGRSPAPGGFAERGGCDRVEGGVGYPWYGCGSHYGILGFHDVSGGIDDEREMVL